LRAALSLARGRSATEGLFYSPRLKDTVDSWTSQIRYDAVLAFCTSMAPYLDSPGLAGVPAIVDFVDVDSQKWFDYAARASGLKRALFQWEGGRVQKLEQETCVRASAVALVSEPEAELCRQSSPAASIHAVPNGVDLEYFGQAITPLRDDAHPPECVFVGALDYRANVEGLTWFCQDVWPDVRRRRPDAKLTLVGRNPLPAVRQLDGSQGVKVVGDVPDVRPFLAQATIVVVPLRVARGIQNKVLEALAAQKPVVASSSALEGLDLVPELHAYRADSPQEWGDCLQRLFNDPALQRRLSSAGRAFVERHHNWNTRLEPFERLLGLRSPMVEVA
jgi:sugar transferase (PEP-CTERM/EpsH1 system associated)